MDRRHPSERRDPMWLLAAPHFKFGGTISALSLSPVDAMEVPPARDRRPPLAS